MSSEAHMNLALFKSSLEDLHMKLNQTDSKTWHIHQFDGDNVASLELYTTQTVSLCQTKLYPHNASVPDKEEDEEEMGCSDLQEDDFCCVVSNSELALVEYRVGYSESFEVPLLYIRGRTVSGSNLTLQEMWRLFEGRTGVAGDSGILWEALTQVEHPYLHIPYFRIHPCKTGRVMFSAKPSTDENYLLLWLSVFGAMVALDLPVSVASMLK